MKLNEVLHRIQTNISNSVNDEVNNLRRSTLQILIKYLTPDEALIYLKQLEGDTIYVSDIVLVSVAANQTHKKFQSALDAVLKLQNEISYQSSRKTNALLAEEACGVKVTPVMVGALSDWGDKVIKEVNQLVNTLNSCLEKE